MLREKPALVDIVLADGFSLLTTVLVLEALRFANLVQRRQVFDWRVVGVQSQTPSASNGFSLASGVTFDDKARQAADAVFVNASYFPEQAMSAKLSAWLRKAERSGAWLLAVDTAPRFLAEAGLLDGKPATIHWEEMDSARETYEKVDFRSGTFERTGRIFTCSGGMAVVDMMLAFISEHQGVDVAQGVRRCFFLNDAESELLMRDRKLSAAINAMRSTVSAPITLEEVAARSNLSVRQLYRLFEREFGMSPGRFYTALRLHKAQGLLLQTKFAVSEIAFTCGYSTASWFVKAYKAFFGVTPGEERARAQRHEPSRAVDSAFMFFQPRSGLLVNVPAETDRKDR